MLFFFKQKTAYEMVSCDWIQTCALPILEVYVEDQRAERLVVEILEANGWVDKDFDNSLRKYANTGLDLVIRIEGRRFGVMIKATRRLMQSSDAARLLQAAKRLKLYGAVIIIPDQALNVDALRVLDGVLVVPVSRIKHLPELLR